tara:strand:+ start:1094 stop:1558 length:465 start_codon:yes stop_codon:yes gene_type:complete
MNTEGTINYVFSSDDRTNSIGTPTNKYEIDFGGFNTQYDNFYCEVIQVVLNGNVLGTNGYLYLVAENLTTGNDRFCPSILNNNEAIVGIISTNIDSLMTNTNISFRTTDVRVPKRVTFKLLKSDFNDCVSGTDINIAGIETRWVVSMRLIPIKK